MKKKIKLLKQELKDLKEIHFHEKLGLLKELDKRSTEIYKLFGESEEAKKRLRDIKSYLADV